MSIPAIVRYETKEYVTLVAVRDLGGEATIHEILRKALDPAGNPYEYPMLIAVVAGLIREGYLARETPMGSTQDRTTELQKCTAPRYKLTVEGKAAIHLAEFEHHRAAWDRLCLSTVECLSEFEERILSAMHNYDHALDVKVIQKMLPESTITDNDMCLSGILRKFTQDGLLSYRHIVTGGSVRRLYQITDKGREAFDHCKSHQTSRRKMLFEPATILHKPSSGRENSTRPLLVSFDYQILLSISQSDQPPTTSEVHEALQRANEMTLDEGQTCEALKELRENAYLFTFQTSAKRFLGEKKKSYYNVTDKGRSILALSEGSESGSRRPKSCPLRSYEYSILRAVSHSCEPQAASEILETLQRTEGKAYTMGRPLATLKKFSEKGYVASVQTVPEQVHCGKRRRCHTLTKKGWDILKQTKLSRDRSESNSSQPSLPQSRSNRGTRALG